MNCAIEGEWTEDAEDYSEPFTWSARWESDGDGWVVSGPYRDSLGLVELSGYCDKSQCELLQSYHEGDSAGQTFQWFFEYQMENAAGQSEIHLTGTWGEEGEPHGEVQGTGLCSK